MSTYVKVLLVLGILAVGVCAALPFRRSDDPADNPPELAVDLGMKMRQGERTARLVPLIVSGETELSPAAGSLPIDPLRSRTTPIWVPERLDESPPSDIGPSFVPLVEVSPAANLPADASPIRAPAVSPFFPTPAQPVPGSFEMGPGLTSVDSIPATPVRHSLRDGDTLAKLARRYLGNESRANEIFQANRKLLASPDVLPLGVEIEIPGARLREDR